MTWDAVNVLAVSQAREIAGKLAGKILNVPRMNQMGISQLLCPFPCDVLVMHQPGKLALAPSGNTATDQQYLQNWPAQMSRFTALTANASCINSHCGSTTRFITFKPNILTSSLRAPLLLVGLCYWSFRLDGKRKKRWGFQPGVILLAMIPTFSYYLSYRHSSPLQNDRPILKIIQKLFC